MSSALKTIGETIRGKRKERNLTIEALAYESGLSPHYFQGVEKGRHNISVAKLENIASVLNLSLAELLEGRKETSIEFKDEEKTLAKTISARLMSLSMDDLEQISQTIDNITGGSKKKASSLKQGKLLMTPRFSKAH